MFKPADHFHGSDLEAIEQLYHIRREDIIPFGANVNPLGISPNVKNVIAKYLDVISEYPDREYFKLKRAISKYTGAAYEHILVGNGSTELISSFISVIKPQLAMTIEPTYSEYKKDIELVGGELISYQLNPDNDFQLQIEDFIRHLPVDLDMLILCNPNNPTSTAISLENLKVILRACAINQIMVMVDETYIEFAENYKELTAIPLVSEFSNLIVIRGVSKFFAAPGLRLGYAICNNAVLQDMYYAQATTWSINAIANIAGQVMFRDKKYIQQTVDMISTEKKLVWSALSCRKTIKLYPPTANFMLVKLLKEGLTSDMVFDHCIKKGLMIRDCQDFKGLDNTYIRFCFMNPGEDDALVNTLLEIV